MDTVSREAPPELEPSPSPAPAATSGSILRAWPWSAILASLWTCSVLVFIGLGATDVVTMEGIVADGARTMDRTHEYAVPYLYGEIYSYKPPLAYWMALASFRLFGEETEWSLRFPFALSGLLMCLAVLLLTSRIAGPDAGSLCAMASVTGAVTIQKLHLAEFDMPVAAGVGIAIAVACYNLAFPRPRWGLWLIGYLALALAFLAKGAPALMFYAPGLLLATGVTRRYKELFKPAHLAGVMLFMLVVAAWVASAYQAAGWAAFEQPFAEARDKGLTWSASHIAATLAKPLQVGVLFLPWTLLLPMSFKSRDWSSEPVRRMALAAAAFVAAGIAVFMIVPADESRYLLPLAVPVAILCGLAARETAGTGAFRRRVIEVFALLIGIGLVAAPLFVPSTFASSRWLFMLLGIVMLGVVVYSIFRGSGSATIWLVAAVASLSWLVHMVAIEPHRASSRSLRTMATSFEAHLSPESVVWTGPVSKHFHHSSLFFYLRRPIQTFSAQGGWPAVGDFVVFFSNEHEALMATVPFDYELIERRKQRRFEYFLARVVRAEPRG